MREPQYRVSVSRTFIAQHYLTVPEPGPKEGSVHSHRFTVELRFAGPELNEYGYLLDIDAVKDALSAIEARYADELLNDLPEFEELNPSVEHFARIVSDQVTNSVDAPAPDRLTVRIWEDDQAWASHERPL